METGGTLAECREPLAERMLSVAAMAGAAGGAVCGAVLGAESGNAFPVFCGTLGTMLGSGFAAGAWCLLVRLWAGVASAHKRRAESSHAVQSHSVTPAHSGVT